MRNDSSKQKNKEIQFSLEAVEAKNVSLVEEFNSLRPDADFVSHTRGDEPPDPPDNPQMGPSFSHARRDEPNPFHF
jgi:hypothetical protein